MHPSKNMTQDPRFDDVVSNWENLDPQLQSQIISIAQNTGPTRHLPKNIIGIVVSFSFHPKNYLAIFVLFVATFFMSVSTLNYFNFKEVSILLSSITFVDAFLFLLIKKLNNADFFSRLIYPILATTLIYWLLIILLHLFDNNFYYIELTNLIAMYLSFSLMLVLIVGCIKVTYNKTA